MKPNIMVHIADAYLEARLGVFKLMLAIDTRYNPDTGRAIDLEEADAMREQLYIVKGAINHLHAHYW